MDASQLLNFIQIACQGYRFSIEFRGRWMVNVRHTHGGRIKDVSLIIWVPKVLELEELERPELLELAVCELV